MFEILWPLLLWLVQKVWSPQPAFSNELIVKARAGGLVCNILGARKVAPLLWLGQGLDLSNPVGHKGLEKGRGLADPVTHTCVGMGISSE